MDYSETLFLKKREKYFVSSLRVSVAVGYVKSANDTQLSNVSHLPNTNYAIGITPFTVYFISK